MPDTWLLDPNRCLTVDEAVRLHRSARVAAEAGRARGAFRPARDGHLVLFLLATGCRISEALQGRVGDVTSHREGTRVCLPILKRRRPASSPVLVAGPAGEDIRAWVAWLRAAGASDACPLFPAQPPTATASTPRPLSRKAVWLSMKKALRVIGVDRAGVAIHATRHAVGVLTLKASGGNLRAVQARLRHDSGRTTEVYARLTPDDFRDAVEGAQALLEGEAR